MKAFKTTIRSRKVIARLNDNGSVTVLRESDRADITDFFSNSDIRFLASQIVKFCK